jgi:hypothetical protein
MLQLCSAADEPWLWDLITLAPTPAHAVLLSEEQVQRVLKAHRIRRITAPEVLTCLQAPALPVAPGTAEAAQAHCGFLLPCLRVLAEQLQACRVVCSAKLQGLRAYLHTLRSSDIPPLRFHGALGCRGRPMGLRCGESLTP